MSDKKKPAMQLKTSSCHKEGFEKNVSIGCEKKLFEEFRMPKKLNPSPLAMKSLFGYNSKVYAKNLTTEEYNRILITSGNLLSIYDYEYDTHKILQVHRNEILSTSVDMDGNFFVTSDKGHESSIIIWDALRSLPVHIIKNFNGNGCPFVKLSPCGKFLLTVVEKQFNKNIKLISLWEWKHRRDGPDVTLEVDSSVYGCLKKVDFCFDNCSYLILTSEKQVLFLTYADEIYSEYYEKVVRNVRKGVKQYSSTKEKDITTKRRICTKRPTVKTTGLGKKDSKTIHSLNKCSKEWNKKKFLIHVPKNLHKIKNQGNFLDSVYVCGTRMAISCTSTGNMIVWSDIGMAEHYHDASPPLSEMTNRKNFLLQLCLDPYPVQLMYSIDSYVVTINSRGQIAFYNNKLIPVFKIEDLGTNAPDHISFNLRPRSKRDELTPEELSEAKERLFLAKESVGPEKKLNKRKMFKNEKHVKKNKEDLNAFVFDAVKNTKRRKVKKWKQVQDLVSCLHNKNEIFDVRDFILTTNQGDIMYVNVTHEDVYEVLNNYFHNLSSMDIHPLQDFLCVGTSYGKLFLLDYNTHVVVKETDLDVQKVLRDDGIDPNDTELMQQVLNITCVKFTPDGYWLACSTLYGDVWILNGHSLLIGMRLRNSKLPILKLLFSKNCDFFAFYDSASHLMLYNTVRSKGHRSLKFICRQRAHFKKITDAAFLMTSGGTEIYTIAEDGYLVKWATDDCDGGSNLIKGSLIVDEFGIPTCLKAVGNPATILMVFNNENKCRLIDTKIMAPICTVQAPPCGAVSLARFLKTDLSGDEFLFFAAGTEVGLIKLPIDGNPFKVTSSFPGAQKVVSICVGKGGNMGFSLARGEHISVWDINISAHNELEKIGGPGITPYAVAIQADPNSMPIADMEILFKVAVLGAAGITTTKPRMFDDKLPVLAVPNFIRSLGFFPSANEAKAIVSELLNGEDILESEKKVSFEQCLKIFYNYRSKRFSDNQIEKSFENICKKIENEVVTQKPEIPSKMFAIFLQKNGEKFSTCQIINFLRALVKPLSKDDELKIMERNVTLEDTPENLINPNSLFDFTPKKITYNYFKKVVLGVDEDTYPECSNEASLVPAYSINRDSLEGSSSEGKLFQSSQRLGKQQKKKIVFEEVHKDV